MKHLALFLFLITVLSNCEQSEPEQVKAKNSYINQIVTKKTGSTQKVGEIEFSTPYSWLKDNNNPEVIDWLAQQEAQTEQYFSTLTSNLSIDENAPIGISHTLQHAYKYYYVEKQFRQNSWAIKQYDTLDENTTALIKNLPDDLVSISQLELDPEGRFVAFEVENSNKHYQWFLYDLINDDYSHHQPTVTFNKTNLIWLERQRIIATSNTSLNYHNLLKSDNFDYPLFQLEDYLQPPENNNKDDNKANIAAKASASTSYINAIQSFDKNFLLVEVKNPENKSVQYWMHDFSKPQKKFTSLLKGGNSNFKYLANIENTFYFQTDLAAPRGRIISIDLEKPQRRYWKEIIAQSSSVLVSAKLINHKWLLEYKNNTQSSLSYSKLNGTGSSSITLDSLTKLAYPLKQTESDKLLLTLETIFTPARPASLNFQTLSIEPIEFSDVHKAKVPSREVAFYRSEDGSRIPISLLQQSKSIQNGKNKALLLTNQGFGQAYDYSFSPLVQQWLAEGNLIALAHIRGGGAYGKSWHKSASGKNKQKAIGDLKAAIEWLYDKNYTNNKQLAIWSERHNSPLVAALLNQSPEIVSAVIFDEAYFDLFNSPFNASFAWKNEFEFLETTKSLNTLLSWSPQQNVAEQNYPSILIQKNSSNPAYLANLQSMQTHNKPILLFSLKKLNDGDEALDNLDSAEWDWLVKSLMFLNAET